MASPSFAQQDFPFPYREGAIGWNSTPTERLSFMVQLLTTVAGL
ncbi:hypothetical protein [Mesorhizobium sp. LNJC405B00]|nr:hypothetical protein [Mesorhizobium sp. LNJC405B00]